MFDFVFLFCDSMCLFVFLFRDSTCLFVFLFWDSTCLFVFHSCCTLASLVKRCWREITVFSAMGN